MVVANNLARTLDSISNGSLITPILEEAILRQDWPEEYPIRIHNGKSRKWNDRFHPSTDITMPELELYNQKHPDIGPTLEREKLHPSTIMTFQIGSALHAMLQSMLIHIGLTTKEECEVYFKEEQLGISGLCDIRTLFLPTGERPLVDIKTCSILPTKPKPEHILQVLIYMDLINPTPIEMGSILYLEKGYPHRMRDFTVLPNSDALDELYKKWMRVREAIKNNDPSSLKKTP